MKRKVLYFYLTQYYLPALIPLKFYKIDEVVIIRNRGEYYFDKYKDFKDLLESEIPDIQVEQRVIDEIEDLNGVIDKDKNKVNFIYFSDEMGVESFYMHEIAIKNFITMVIISQKSSKLIEFKNFKKKIYNVKDIALNIDNFIENFGGEIASHNTEIFSTKKVNRFIDWIIANPEKWHNMNVHLFKKGQKFVIPKFKDANYSNIYFNKIQENTRKFMYEFLYFLQEIEAIDFHQSQNRIKIIYKEQGIANIFKKPGTWLEALVLRVLKSIENIDEVKASVQFFWDGNLQKVRNELDILAVEDQQMICISCKDTNSYGKEALNELDVYSKKIGGRNVKKLLVATEDPYYQFDLDRSRSMDIKIIKYENDYGQLVSNLYNAIHQNNK